jgi:hypothetical protein
MNKLVQSTAFGVARHFHTSSLLPKGRFTFYNIHKKVTDPARQDPDYFEKEAAKLPIDDHYLDALELLWKEKIGSERELTMKAADRMIGKGHQYALPDVDKTQPRLPYQTVDALATAPESVQKIFSIEYGQRKDLTAAWKSELISSVQRHHDDNESHQMKIAWATALIRHYNKLYEEKGILNTAPRWLRQRIFLVAGYRRKLLRLLREQDSEEFEKVLSTLQIGYQVPKPPEHVKTRKAWSEFQLKRRVQADKEKRLKELHESLLAIQDSRGKEIDNRLQELSDEEAKIHQRIGELDKLEGKITEVDGKYQPKIVEELTFSNVHSNLFYHPKPAVTSR